MSGKRTKTDLERFWPKTRVEDKCLVWVGATAKNGYGTFSLAPDHPLVSKPQKPRSAVTIYAHRFIYEIVFGKLPPRTDVMHSCDNRACVKLQHLSPGTRAANMHDAAVKQRMPKGSDKSPLTEDEVRQIRELYATGRYSQVVLAERFGVHQMTISNICRRKTWKHV